MVLASLVGVVGLASLVSVVGLTPPVGVVDLTPPVCVVVLASPVCVVVLASPVCVVVLASPVGVANLPRQLVGPIWRRQVVGEPGGLQLKRARRRSATSTPPFGGRNDPFLSFSCLLCVWPFLEFHLHQFCSGPVEQHKSGGASGGLRDAGELDAHQRSIVSPCDDTASAK